MNGGRTCPRMNREDPEASESEMIMRKEKEMDELSKPQALWGGRIIEGPPSVFKVPIPPIKKSNRIT